MPHCTRTQTLAGRRVRIYNWHNKIAWTKILDAIHFPEILDGAVAWFLYRGVKYLDMYSSLFHTYLLNFINLIECCSILWPLSKQPDCDSWFVEGAGDVDRGGNEAELSQTKDSDCRQHKQFCWRNLPCHIRSSLEVSLLSFCIWCMLLYLPHLVGIQWPRYTWRSYYWLHALLPYALLAKSKCLQVEFFPWSGDDWSQRCKWCWLYINYPCVLYCNRSKCILYHCFKKLSASDH